MYNQKNLDITPGLPFRFSFPVLGDDYLKVDTSTYTFKFEILDPKDGSLFFSTDAGDKGLGEIKVTLDEADTAELGSGLFSYRLVIKDAEGFSSLAAKGFLTSSAPEYDETAQAGSGTITLPDGALYVNRPMVIEFDTWYATTSSYRIIVSGVGFMTLDLRDNTGGVFIRTAIFQTESSDPVEWRPFFGQFTAFRIVQSVGNNTVKLLP